MDLAIIYLSLGAPVGVYRFFRLQTPVRVIDSLKAIGVFLIWPPFAAVALAQRFSRFRQNEQIAEVYTLDDFVHEKARLILNELKPKLRLRSGNRAAHTFEILERYAELSLLLTTHSTNESGHFVDLLRAAGHQNAKTGSFCLERRNQRNLKKHQMAARAELIDVIRSAGTDQTCIAESVIRIAELIGDGGMIETLGEQIPDGDVKEIEAISTRGKPWRNIEVQSLKTTAGPEN